MHATHATGLEPRRWTRAEYDRMVEQGLLDEDDRVELIDGEILTMAPHCSPHAATVMHVQKVLEGAFGPRYHVRVQMPLVLDPMSEPEPDLAVVTGVALDYVHGHPERAALLVEVADTTLSFARRWKSSLYARGGIPEYWIVNLPDRLLEVYRDPAEDPAAPYGWGFRTSVRLAAGDVVSPLGAPGAQIAVADLLPAAV
jgi:Uma2 family endonuclease